MTVLFVTLVYLLNHSSAACRGMLTVQNNLGVSYSRLGRDEEALLLRREVYSGYLRLNCEDAATFNAAINYATSLGHLSRFKEAISLLRKCIPVARRVLGEGDETTLRMRSTCAAAIINDTGATLDDLREALTTLEDAGRIARRVFGVVHPLTAGIGHNLSAARAALRARETPASSA